MEIYQYEKKFIDGVNQTYDMLKELDEADNDYNFWKVYRRIKAGFDDIQNAMRNYYMEVKKGGGDIENCSLAHELSRGLNLLDEKYFAIHDKVSEISAIPN